MLLTYNILLTLLCYVTIMYCYVTISTDNFKGFFFNLFYFYIFPSDPVTF